ncbi:MAG: ABC transporter ATP-binding protein [Intestinimonas sp.]|jgi:ABC-2 type transport system ATP-binding protein|nr:ABC transporter ATP-binding protein [Intestinimonas sp.]
MEYALEVKDLTKRYQGFTLDHVNFTLPSGCIMGFIGENGAGKSTAIKLILDLIHPDDGEISVLGTSMCAGGKQLREQIGVVMDESSFPDNLTLEDIGKILNGCYQTWSSGRFQQYQDKFSLPGRKPVKQFSRGMKMKLAIAAALSHNSRLLILDEATSGLDPIIRDEILDEFLSFLQDEDHSILISSHILSDLEKVCDYITFLHQGKVLFSKPKDELMESYVVVKCSERELEALDPAAVLGVRRNRFGVEALAQRHAVPTGLITDPATIEDIMLYSVRGEKQ